MKKRTKGLEICLKGRKAIAMIELIFAIVIIGITLMSAPMLISQASKSAYTSITQEAIAAGAAEISMILARAWDENNTNITTGAPILNVSNGDPDLNAANRANVFPNNLLSTRSYSNNLGDTDMNASMTLGSDSGDFDDLDDKDGVSILLKDYNATTTQEGDLIDKTITMLTTISYIDDNASWSSGMSYSPTIPSSVSASTNIKAIDINLTSGSSASELGKTIVFKAFSANIGTYKLQRRELP